MRLVNIGPTSKDYSYERRTRLFLKKAFGFRSYLSVRRPCTKFPGVSLDVKKMNYLAVDDRNQGLYSPISYFSSYIHFV